MPGCLKYSKILNMDEDGRSLPVKTPSCSISKAAVRDVQSHVSFHSALL